MGRHRTSEEGGFCLALVPSKDNMGGFTEPLLNAYRDGSQGNCEVFDTYEEAEESAKVTRTSPWWDSVVVIPLPKGHTSKLNSYKVVTDGHKE